MRKNIVASLWLALSFGVIGFSPSARATCPTGPNYNNCVKEEQQQRAQPQQQPQQQRAQPQPQYQRQQPEAGHPQTPQSSSSGQSGQYRPPSANKGTSPTTTFTPHSNTPGNNNVVRPSGTPSNGGASSNAVTTFTPHAGGSTGGNNAAHPTGTSSNGGTTSNGVTTFTPHAGGSTAGNQGGYVTPPKRSSNEGVTSNGVTTFTPHAKPTPPVVQPTNKVAVFNPTAVRINSGKHYVYQGRSYQPFVAPVYVWPKGYVYTPYSYGMILPIAFLATEQYFLMNYLEYGLTAPAYGLQWVRFGPDLLLVNLSTAQVMEAIPSMFYESQ